MAMKLSTGKIAFPIEFDNGDKVNIYFNPNDPELFIRFSKFESNVDEKIQAIEDIELDADGTPKDEALIEQFEKAIGIIKDELDTAFGSKISDAVFKYCSPFAIIGGEYFLVQFIQAIRPEIEKHNKKANTEMSKKMAKHLDKYRK